MLKQILLIFLLFSLTACTVLNGKSGNEIQPESNDVKSVVWEVHKVKMESLTHKVDNFVVVFDNSASMTEYYQNRSKFEIAKEFLNRLNLTIPDLPIKTGLRTYGNPIYTSLRYGMTEYSKEEFNFALRNCSTAEGASPLDMAIDGVANDLRFLPGESALIIVTDGKEINSNPEVNAAKLRKILKNNICIYTILIGNDPAGSVTMEKLFRDDQCGFALNADEILTGKDMADYVTTVFLKVDSSGLVAIKEEEVDSSELITIEEETVITRKCPEPPQNVLLDDDGCWDIQDVLFDFDKSNIKPTYFKLLDRIAQTLVQNPSVRIKIDGHTDNTGSEAYNKNLSLDRARTSMEYLLGKGAKRDQISIKGFGFSIPKEKNDAFKNKEKNRRVEFLQIQ